MDPDEIEQTQPHSGMGVASSNGYAEHVLVNSHTSCLFVCDEFSNRRSIMEVDLGVELGVELEDMQVRQVYNIYSNSQYWTGISVQYWTGRSVQYWTGGSVHWTG